MGRRVPGGAAAALWALGVALLIPLIVVAGLLAVIGTVALRARRRRRPALQPQQPTRPAVVHLDPTAANVTFGGTA